ncbi:MAG: PepSY domain-containing protein [Xanthomonadales bacterium]|nr:PepSY domain-containing protein [Xanthomonadales bacterium]
MKNNSSIKTFIFAVVVMLSFMQKPLADEDHMEARQLLESGEILPLELILKKARVIYPGRILEVELELEDQTIVYELEILGDNGVSKEIYINAKTGKQLLTKEDD